MNKKMKNLTIATLIMSTSLMSFGVVFADNQSLTTATGKEPVTIIKTDVFNMPEAYILNDQVLKMDQMLMPVQSPQGQVFVPLKSFASGLGYTLIWNGKESSLGIEFDGNVKLLTYEKDSSYEFGTVLKDAEGVKYPATIKAGRLFVTPDFFAQAMNGVVVYDQGNQVRIDAQRYAPDEASTLGEISEMVTGKDGIQVLVKGQSFGKNGHGEISLAITNKIPVKLSNGKEVSLSDLKVGDQIYVAYGMSLTKSLPPMGQATSVTVLKDEGLVEGKVFWKQVSDEKHPGTAGIAAPIYQMRVVGTNDYVLTLSNTATIEDLKGNVKSFSDIKEGSIVKVFTAAYATMSYPAQTAAYKIIIVK